VDAPLREIGPPVCRIVTQRYPGDNWLRLTNISTSLALGDRVEIVSRVYDLRRVGGTWQHQVYRNGDLVALDYSAGAFLDRARKLRPPLQAMLDALVRG
jgi:hypothetical protein